MAERAILHTAGVTAEEITRELTKPFPREAIKQREGGRGTMLSYVEGETVIRRLIAATGNRFETRIIGIEAKPAGTTRSGSPQTLLVATVELCIPGLGCRQHIGVQLTSESGGEDLAKGAVTDAIKKAATLFGVGLELYGPDYEGGTASAEPVDFAQTRGRRVAAVEDARPTPTRVTTEQLVTPKQVQFIAALAARVGLDEAALAAEVERQYGCALAYLSRQDASAYIEQLRTRPLPPEPDTAPAPIAVQESPWQVANRLLHAIARERFGWDHPQLREWVSGLRGEATDYKQLTADMLTDLAKELKAGDETDIKEAQQAGAFLLAAAPAQPSLLSAEQIHSEYAARLERARTMDELSAIANEMGAAGVGSDELRAIYARRRTALTAGQ